MLYISSRFETTPEIMVKHSEIVEIAQDGIVDVNSQKETREFRNGERL